MKIATYNINGVRVRLPRIIDWIKQSKPDVALLQEIKCEDDKFPENDFSDLGYNVAIHGQKGYNGVAILSKYPLDDVIKGLPGDDSDTQSRWIEAVIQGSNKIVRVCCLYLPNGNPVPGEKFDYKLAWMTRLQKRAAKLLEFEEPLILAGDYNVIPHIEDAKNPEKWIDDALFRLETRTEWRKLVNLGFQDAFRLMNNQEGQFTFWDFQGNAWNKNDGIRIDHLLLSPQCADLLLDCKIDREVRGWEKPSDHVPIWVKLDC
ncbi:MAG: exodeoxyribonuclease III [Paracoccaceae bacterium]|nr:exodeoxyribonuclease III [Paracoccaceae bacterium]MDE2760195.1 exodeoxyribonuclease III [Paracoccaceae bacterium]MDE2917576.1 exodeoxyribonuclease III [Paracoccaceae bacterium]